MRRLRAGFSLAEVVIAMGVVSFAFVGVLGLIPAGFGVFRQAMDHSVGAQIAQRVIADVQQAEFGAVIGEGADEAFSMAQRYFDEQGEERPGPGGAVYQVKTRVWRSTVVPGEGAGQAGVNPDLATITVQVACNPSGRKLAEASAETAQRLLWNGSYEGASEQEGRVPVAFYSAQVARIR
jgi:uncharacterized protein (TIGR02598 family)